MAVPAATPVTTPDEDPTVAIAVLLLDHVPLPETDKVVVWPTQTAVRPVIPEGMGLTVIVLVAEQPANV